MWFLSSFSRVIQMIWKHVFFINSSCPYSLYIIKKSYWTKLGPNCWAGYISRLIVGTFEIVKYYNCVYASVCCTIMKKWTRLIYGHFNQFFNWKKSIWHNDNIISFQLKLNKDNNIVKFMVSKYSMHRSKNSRFRLILKMKKVDT